MGRNLRSSRRTSERAPAAAPRKRKDKRLGKDPAVQPRRSSRIASNAFAPSRIAAKRLTIPLGFFTGGVASTASRKTDPLLTDRSRLILDEDLHALLRNLTREGNEHFGRANRNSRADPAALPPKNGPQRAQDENYNTVSGYYLEIAAKNRRESERIEAARPGGDITYNPVGFFGEAGAEPTPEPNGEEELISPSYKATERSLSTVVRNASLDPADSDEPRTANFRFVARLHAQLKPTRRSHKREYVLKIKLSAQQVDDVFDGKVHPRPLDAMSTKRCLPDEYDGLPDVPLVPQSQWVYNTPDKRIVKRFVFEDRSEKIVPAVIQTTKRNKVLYDIKNEIAQTVNLCRFKDESVPIDRRYLNAICETAAPDNAKKRPKLCGGEKENFFSFKTPFPAPAEQPPFKFEPSRDDFNVFLSNPEETIDIKPMDAVDPDDSGAAYSPFESDPYEKAPIDYRHQLLLATQRPSKTVKRIPKRHMLKGKSLSFENTPPRARTPSFEPKKLELSKSLEECLDEFESQFNILGENSGNLQVAASSGSDGPAFPNFAVPTFKFYPRRNFDYKQ